jgi:hypothetical protein
MCGTGFCVVSALSKKHVMAIRFRLMALFKLTALVALFAFGVSVERVDWQTGVQIKLFAVGLILAWLFLIFQLWCGQEWPVDSC